MTEDVEIVEPEPAPKAKPSKKAEFEPEIVDAEPPDIIGNTVARQDENRWIEPTQDWPHQWIEFQGDRLAVRKPTTQAIAAYSLSLSRFVAPQIQNEISGLFMARHMSAETYARVMDRFMNGDDPDYNDKTVGELMRTIIELATKEMPDNRASRRASSKG
jgi:hypothetical protein